jgi:hypothetical protein
VFKESCQWPLKYTSSVQNKLPQQYPEKKMLLQIQEMPNKMIKLSKESYASNAVGSYVTLLRYFKSQLSKECCPKNFQAFSQESWP